MHRDILRPKINKSVTSHFSFWLPALFSVVIAISAHEEILSQYPLFAHLVNLVALLVPSIQGWQSMEQASQRGLLIAAWSWVSVFWLLILILPGYIRWRCKPDRFEMVSAEQAFGNRGHIYKGQGVITNVLMPYIFCFIAASFLMFSYESAHFYSTTTYAECTYQCSLEWFYFCLGMLLFSYALPLLFMLFIYITLDLKAVITQKPPYQGNPNQ